MLVSIMETRGYDGVTHGSRRRVRTAGDVLLALLVEKVLDRDGNDESN